jgi:hypothetical protein
MVGSRDDLPFVAGTLKAETRAFVRGAQLGERGLDRPRRGTDDSGELRSRDRLLGDEEDGLDGVG